MRFVWGIWVLGLVLVSQAGHAQMGCRAVQVTCAPELGMMSVRTLNYDETRGCERGEGELKALYAQGIYPIPEKDGPLLTTACVLPMGEAKLKVASWVENGNVQGECGAYGAVAVVDLWVAGRQLLEEVPIQTCRMRPNYDAEDITLRDEGDSYSVMFGGNVENEHNYYSFRKFDHQPEGFEVPVTRWSVVGVSDTMLK